MDKPFWINKKSCTKIVRVASSLFWREEEQGWRVGGVALAVLVVARGASTLRNKIVIAGVFFVRLAIG